LEGVAARIFSLLFEHKSARPPLVRPQVSASALGWSSPPRHGLKINVNAAVGPRFFVNCGGHKRLERKSGICWFKESEHHHPSSS